MIRHCILTGLLLYVAVLSFAQRIEIDRLERDFEGSFRDREAYELSQKFIQIDSTYYTGYYFEGLYRYFRASDQLGYEKAIKPLKKAIELLDKDFRKQLRRTTDIRVYINTYQIQRKYAALVGLLEKCYQYTGQPDQAMIVLRKLLKKDFVFNFGVDPYATMSWIYHRNRTYSPDRYPFLKGSIEENVREASIYADSILLIDRKNNRFIRQWFPDFGTSSKGNYFHYKDVIYSYLLKVDSAEYCAKNLDKLDYLSKNNYGNLQFIQAKFEKAEDYYNQAREQDAYVTKSTKEFDYMQSVISVFKNDLDNAEAIVNSSMDRLGPTPGFGWNNIAMSRVKYYAGDLEVSKKFRDKAANFKELHINSTWGKIQYDRNTLLFQYLYHQQKIRELQFADRYYWLNPQTIFRIAEHYFKKENAHLLLTSELSANPERFLVLYNIFSSENTIFFDEIWEVIKTFNPDYFIRLFEEKLEEDIRPGIAKYFHYYIARFYLEDDDQQKAIEYFQKILEDTTLDVAYEKLLIARVYEGLSQAFRALDKEKESYTFLQKFYQAYPQLVPYSSLKMKFKLEVSSTSLSEREKVIIEQLRRSDIEWVENDQTEEWPTVTISFEGVEDPVMTYEVEIEDAPIKGSIALEKYTSPGKILAFRLFSIRLST